MPGAAAGDDTVTASVRHGTAVSAAAAAQGLEILRGAFQARSRLVDHARCSGGFLLHLVAGNDFGRGPETVRVIFAASEIEICKRRCRRLGAHRCALSP